MGRKRGKTAFITALIAGALALVLLIAGTLLRMNTHELGFGEAFCSFVSDTFHAGA